MYDYDFVAINIFEFEFEFEIEIIRLVLCDRIRPITLLTYIPHADRWGDARSQQKSETVAIAYNHHRCERHFISLFPFS